MKLVVGKLYKHKINTTDAASPCYIVEYCTVIFPPSFFAAARRENMISYPMPFP